MTTEKKEREGGREEKDGFSIFALITFSSSDVCPSLDLEAKISSQIDDAN